MFLHQIYPRKLTIIGLKPNNLRRAKDNLTREERLALGKLKSSDNVFRIQDKGSRFVIISQNEYKDKMLAQLNNDLHYNKLDHDPTSEHFEKIKDRSVNRSPLGSLI